VPHTAFVRTFLLVRTAAVPLTFAAVGLLRRARGYDDTDAPHSDAGADIRAPPRRVCRCRLVALACAAQLGGSVRTRRHCRPSQSLRSVVRLFRPPWVALRCCITLLDCGKVCLGQWRAWSARCRCTRDIGRSYADFTPRRRAAHFFASGGAHPVKPDAPAHPRAPLLFARLPSIDCGRCSRSVSRAHRCGPPAFARIGVDWRGTLCHLLLSLVLFCARCTQ
jgi:hypothetical protein